MDLGVYDITIDFSKNLIHNSASVTFKEGDINTAVVRAKLTHQGKIIDLTESTVSLKVETFLGDTITDSVDIIDPAKGLVEISFKTNALVEGTNFFEIVIVKGEGVKKSPTLTYRVFDSIDDANSVEGTNEYPILIQLIKDANNAINNANRALNVANEMTLKLESTIGKANTAITNAQDATNEAKEAVNDVNKAISAGTQDLEVKQARVDSNGVEHDTLKLRLESDLKKGKMHFETVEGSYISTDTEEGYARNVEIKGNTIQDTNNLADIRSVGDKVEGQELYEIPLLCTGKNLFNFESFRGINIAEDNYSIDEANKTITLKRTNTGKYELIEFDCKIPKNTESIFSYKKEIVGGDTNQHAVTFFYVFADGTTKAFSHASTTKEIILQDKDIIKLQIGMAAINGAICKFSEIQVKEGTQATPYEPYIEDKLTILSPCQIEKVGDLEDRIIEKDGVWGVEKDVTTDSFDGSENWETSNSLSNEETRLFTLRIQGAKDSQLNIICDKYKSFNVYPSEVREEGVYIGASNKLFIRVFKNKLETDDVSGFKKFLSKESFYIKYVTTQPQFIPLPHSQQVKLRTFANKTNIQFLCDVEGTIKADVPKSLGATVNTHTTQIDNLSKELDRVKKLEQATTTTVKTESDFTVVEETNQGYFEDVCLKGKTLVNLVSNGVYSVVSDRVNVNLVDNAMLREKNISIFNYSDKPIAIDIYSVSSGKYKRYFSIQPNTHKYEKLQLDETVGIVSGTFSNGWTSDELDKFKKSILILEGDHTQNPPGYFERLASVGDGSDEIVVSTSNHVFKNSSLESGNIYGSTGKPYVDANTVRTIDFINVLPNTKLYLEYENSGVIRFYDKYENYINKPVVLTKELTTPDNCYKIKLVFNSVDLNTKYSISTIENVNAEPHKSDKKRVLYFDAEDNTWEKPILREWDSIEKHSDGKYYYHVRDEQIVFNGSENWSAGSVNENTIQFVLAIPNGMKVSAPCITDKFINSKNGDIDRINITSNIYLNISKTKLTTQDVAGFKAWLQANNVTVVYQLAQEKIYECTNIDLITYANETNYVVKSGVFSPYSELKVHSNISNVLSLLQEKVSVLESDINNYKIIQNRIMLESRYIADNVSFSVNVASYKTLTENSNYDLYKLILNNIIIGKSNYDKDSMEALIDFYVMNFNITFEQAVELLTIIKYQHEPKEENVE